MSSHRTSPNTTASRPLLERPSALALAFALALAANLLPILSVSWPPMGDYGGHIELMDIVARYDDPNTLYTQVYALQASAGPNTLTLAVAWLLGRWLAADTLARLLVCAYVVGMPLAMASVAHAFGRPRALGLLAAPLAFNAILNVGFLNYLVAMPPMLLAVALARGYAEHKTARRALALASALLVTWFSHVLAFLFVWPICLFLVALFAGEPATDTATRPSRWRRLLATWPLAVPIPLLVAWSWRMFVALQATETGRTFGTEGGLGLVYASPAQLLAALYPWSMRFFRGATDELGAVALVLVWGLLLVIARRQRRTVGAEPAHGRLQWARGHALELVTVCCGLAYAALPAHTHEFALLNHRVVMLIVLLLSIWPRTALRGRAALALLPMTALAVAYPVAVRAEFVAFEDEQVRALPAMIEALPDRSRLAYVMVERQNPRTYMGPLWHLPKALHTTRNGGVTDDSFAARPYTPVQYLPGATPFRLDYGLDFWRSPHVFDYDHVLLRSEAEPGGALHAPHLRMRAHDGHWWLFDVLATQRGITRVMAGAPTGDAAESLCDDGQKMTGIVGGHTEAALQWLRPVCRPAAAPRPAQLGVAAGAVTAQAHCPPQQVVVGVDGREADVIGALALVCSAPETVEPLWTSDVRGRTFSLRCPDRQHALGIRAHLAGSITAFGLLCGDAEPVHDAPATKEIGVEPGNPQ